MHAVYRNDIKQKDIVWETAVQPNVDGVSEQESESGGCPVSCPSHIPCKHPPRHLVPKGEATGHAGMEEEKGAH